MSREKLLGKGVSTQFQKDEPVLQMDEPVVQIERVTVRVLPDGRMTRRDTARYIGVEDKTLANWGLIGKGPPSVLVGGRRFYYKDRVDTYIRGDATSG